MSKKYEICSQGPCWDNYIYVGPKPRTEGSCVTKKKVACLNKKNPRWSQCDTKLNCSTKTKTKPKEEIIKPKNNKNNRL